MFAQEMQVCFERKQVDDSHYLEVERDDLSPLLLHVSNGVPIVSFLSTLDSLTQEHKSA